MSGLDTLAGLPLRGQLYIEFEDGIDNWDDDQCSLPESIQLLWISDYPGIRIPLWVNGMATNVLTSLSLIRASRVKYLPPLSRLPHLKHLSISDGMELEYVEEEGSSSMASAFFPRLEQLKLYGLPKLKGWRRKPLENPPSLFPSLYELMISHCEELKSIPLCPRLHTLHLTRVGRDLLQHLMSKAYNPSLEYISFTNCKGLTSFSDEAFTSLGAVDISGCNDLKIVDLSSSHLTEITIIDCDGLRSFQVQRPTSLKSLMIYNCSQLKDFHTTQANALESLNVQICPKLELWEEGKRCVDWDSLLNLSFIMVDSAPPSKMLPNNLQQRQALRKLKILDVKTVNEIRSQWMNVEARVESNHAG